MLAQIILLKIFMVSGTRSRCNSVLSVVTYLPIYFLMVEKSNACMKGIYHTQNKVFVEYC